VDRTTKFLLLLIGGGLWANAWPHLTGRASAQQSDICLNVGDCLASIDGWAAQTSHYLASIASDMKLLVAVAQSNKPQPHVEPVAPVKPKAAPASAPLAAKPSPCLTGAC
jgi:hypothetical protein